MSKGPRGEQRPDDPVDAAILVARIATGAAEEPVSVRARPRQQFDLRVPDAPADAAPKAARSD